MLLRGVSPHVVFPLGSQDHVERLLDALFGQPACSPQDMKTHNSVWGRALPAVLTRRQTQESGQAHRGETKRATGRASD